MVAQVADISWSDFGSALPAFLTIVVMPLTYSIANGIGAGFVSWVLIKLLSGRGREVSWLLYVVAAGFLLYFARGPLEALLGVG
jgi:AGZA family xanthine/uracil permease-like MFS transporter